MLSHDQGNVDMVVKKYRLEEDPILNLPSFKDIGSNLINNIENPHGREIIVIKNDSTLFCS